MGQVLSHWTWLPPVREQLEKANNGVIRSGKQRVIRLMTPIGTRYEDAYAKAHPFDRFLEEMMQPEMVRETADFMWRAVEDNVETSILINNRAGGNAPLIARRVAEQLLSK